MILIKKYTLLKESLPLISKKVYKSMEEEELDELFFVTDNKDVAEKIKKDYPGNLTVSIKKVFRKWFGYTIWLVHTQQATFLSRYRDTKIAKLKFICNPKQWQKALKLIEKKIDKKGYSNVRYYLFPEKYTN